MAWAGAAVFAAALVYFLLSYAIRFGVVVWGTPDPAAVAFNVTLFSVFALHHSVFARERIRARVMRHVPAGLERSIYVWLASLLFVAVCALWQPVAGVVWHFEGAVEWLLRIGQFIGISLSVRAAAIIDVFDLAGVRQVTHAGRTLSGRPGAVARPTVTAHPAEFKVAGPYALVRHPIYLGWFLIVFCVSTMTATRMVFAVISSVYVLIAIPFEERSLRASSGGAYDQYIARVRWRVLPGLY